MHMSMNEIMAPFNMMVLFISFPAMLGLMIQMTGLLAGEKQYLGCFKFPALYDYVTIVYAAGLVLYHKTLSCPVLIISFMFGIILFIVATVFAIKSIKQEMMKSREPEDESSL